MPTETGFDSDIDQFDRRILDSLAEDGRMSITELAEAVGVSEGSVVNFCRGIGLSGKDAGRNLNLIVIVVGAFRLFMGGGIL